MVNLSKILRQRETSTCEKLFNVQEATELADKYLKKAHDTANASSIIKQRPMVLIEEQEIEISSIR